MDRKTFTVLLTSNRKGKIHRLTVSAAWFKAVGFFATIIFVILGSASMDYMSLLLKEGENKRLKVENASLNRQIKVVEDKLAHLENALERVRKFESKLRLITKIDEDTQVTHLAIGPMPKSGQAFLGFNEEMEKRAPASEFLDSDKAFLEKPALDDEKGELGLVKTRSYASLSVRLDTAVKAAQLRETSVITLHETLSERQSRLNNTPNIKPSSGWYTSRFGYRIDPFTGKPNMHKGLDLAASYGAPVRAPANGTVSYVAYEPGYGKVVAIDHGYGVKSRYAHNSQIYVEVGQKIQRRDVIAAVGSTGRSSGPHLHYEIRIHGVAVDPINYILDE